MSVNKLKKRRYSIILLLLLMFIFLFSACDVAKRDNDKLVIDNKPKKIKVHYIDVGQADCILINIKDEKHIMIDAGNRDDFKIIENYLNEKNVKKLEALILTHPHEDHIGSAANVIKNFKPNKVYMPDATANTRVFENTLKAIEETKTDLIHTKAGDKIIDEENLKLEVLAPINKEYKDLNDYSIVTKLTYMNNSFLFTGDAEHISEEEMIKKGYNLKSNVLKLGHHGSSTSTTDKFLKEVSPEYAIITCGKDNSYGHPHKETIEKMKKNNIKTYRTDTMGHIVCISDGKNITVLPEKLDEIEKSSFKKNENLFIKNEKSNTFHTLDCIDNYEQANKTVLYTYNTVLNSGYLPCENCISKE